MERLFVGVEIEINRSSTTTNKKSEKANHEFLHFSLFSLTSQSYTIKTAISQFYCKVYLDFLPILSVFNIWMTVIAVYKSIKSTTSPSKAPNSSILFSSCCNWFAIGEPIERHCHSSQKIRIFFKLPEEKPLNSGNSRCSLSLIAYGTYPFTTQLRHIPN